MTLMNNRYKKLPRKYRWEDGQTPLKDRVPLTFFAFGLLAWAAIWLCA